MKMEKQAVVTQTFFCAEALYIFASMMTKPGKKSYRDLASEAFEAANAFRAEAVARGQMQIKPVQE